MRWAEAEVAWTEMAEVIGKFYIFLVISWSTYFI